MASSILLSPLRDRFDAFRAWHGSAREPGSGPWLRRGSFLGIVDLQASINRYLAEHNADAGAGNRTGKLFLDSAQWAWLHRRGRVFAACA